MVNRPCWTLVGPPGRPRTQSRRLLAYSPNRPSGHSCLQATAAVSILIGERRASIAPKDIPPFGELLAAVTAEITSAATAQSSDSRHQKGEVPASIERRHPGDIRTSLRLDDDLFIEFEKRANKEERTLFEVVNLALRRGLSTQSRSPRAFKQRTRDLGRPSFDVTTANAVAGALDDDRLHGSRGPLAGRDRRLSLLGGAASTPTSRSTATPTTSRSRPTSATETSSAPPDTRRPRARASPARSHRGRGG